MEIRSAISVLLTKPALIRCLAFFIRPHRLVIRFYLSSFFRSLAILPENSVLNIVSGYGRNLKLVLRIGDKLNPQYTHYWLGLYELDVQRLFNKVIKKGFVVYDIGSYLGFYSLLAGRLTGPTGRVYAFEPFPRNVERIECHSSLNKMQDTVFCIPKAVTDKTGKAPYRNFGREDWNRLVDTDFSKEGPSSRAELSAETISLDEFVFQEGHPAPDLIKIDAEGAERKVIAGARQLLKKFKPVIICELHYPESAMQTREELMYLGYRIEDMNRNHIIAWPKERP